MPNRYTVVQRFDLEQPDDSNTAQFDTQIDLPLLLSQRLQTNVRQGNVIKIHKVQLGLVPRGGDLDTGFSVSSLLQWAPATKNSVKAWQMAFNTWYKQKQLTQNAVGQGIRFDDFEVAWDFPRVTSRTSTMLAGGLLDAASEKVCIYGTSSEGGDITLDDIFESASPQMLPSRFPMDNSVVKESKFTAEFPPARQLVVGANWSTVIGASLGDVDSGASYNADAVYVEDKNSLCGVLRATGYILAEDVGAAIADQLELVMNITCEISTPLAYKPRSATTKKTGSSKSMTPKRTSYKKRS